MIEDKLKNMEEIFNLYQQSYSNYQRAIGNYIPISDSTIDDVRVGHHSISFSYRPGYSPIDFGDCNIYVHLGFNYQEELVITISNIPDGKEIKFIQYKDDEGKIKIIPSKKKVKVEEQLSFEI